MLELTNAILLTWKPISSVTGPARVAVVQRVTGITEGLGATRGAKERGCPATHVTHRVIGLHNQLGWWTWDGGYIYGRRNWRRNWRRWWLYRNNSGISHDLLERER